MMTIDGFNIFVGLTCLFSTNQIKINEKGAGWCWIFVDLMTCFFSRQISYFFIYWHLPMIRICAFFNPMLLIWCEVSVICFHDWSQCQVLFSLIVGIVFPWFKSVCFLIEDVLIIWYVLFSYLPKMFLLRKWNNKYMIEN
jgi:hypothetical protein